MNFRLQRTTEYFARCSGYVLIETRTLFHKEGTQSRSVSISIQTNLSTVFSASAGLTPSRMDGLVFDELFSSSTNAGLLLILNAPAPSI